MPPRYQRPPAFSPDYLAGRPAVIFDLNELFLVSWCDGQCVPSFSLGSVTKKEKGRYVYYIRNDVDQFLLTAAKMAHVYIWSSKLLENLRECIEIAFPLAKHWIKGAFGQQLCTTTSKPFPSRKPIFFKNLKNFWELVEGFNADNTLIVDNSLYKVSRNPPGTFIVVPSMSDQPEEQMDRFLFGDLGDWLLKWLNSIDPREWAQVDKWKQKECPRQLHDVAVTDEMRTKEGRELSWREWNDTSRRGSTTYKRPTCHG